MIKDKKGGTERDKNEIKMRVWQKQKHRLVYTKSGQRERRGKKDGIEKGWRRNRERKRGSLIDKRDRDRVIQMCAQRK